MSDPHFNDDRIVEREVVERPARRRYVSERRVGGAGMGMNSNPVVLVIAGVLAVFILVLIFGYLL